MVVSTASDEQVKSTTKDIVAGDNLINIEVMGVRDGDGGRISSVKHQNVARVEWKNTIKVRI